MNRTPPSQSRANARSSYTGLEGGIKKRLPKAGRAYSRNGGRIWVCGACAKPRGITQEQLVEGAQIVGAATAVEALVSGAQTLSF